MFFSLLLRKHPVKSDLSTPHVFSVWFSMGMKQLCNIMGFFACFLLSLHKSNLSLLFGLFTLCFLFDFLNQWNLTRHQCDWGLGCFIVEFSSCPLLKHDFLNILLAEDVMGNWKVKDLKPKYRLSILAAIL